MMSARLGLMCVAFATCIAPVAAQETPQSVGHFDAAQYMGRWYEIASYPNRFQADCVRNTTATYTLLPKGVVGVENRCEKQDGSVTQARGEASPADAPGRLKVRFAPKWLSLLPWVWAPYWVIQLAPDYRYAVVSEPEREYLWILSRSPRLSPQDRSDIMAKLETQGFDLKKLRSTEQTSTPSTP